MFAPSTRIAPLAALVAPFGAMVAAPSRSTGRATCLAAAALLGAACSGGGDSVPAGVSLPSSVPMVLEVSDGAWPDGEATLARHIDLPESDPQAWTTSVEVERAMVDEARMPRISEPALMLQPVGQPFVIHVPVDVSLADFDLVRVRLATRGFFRLAAAVRYGTRENFRTEFIEREGVIDPAIVDLDLGALADDKGDIDRISLVFEALTHQCGILNVDLIQRPAGVRLPSPVDGPTHIAVGSGSREGSGLLPGVTLEAEVPAPYYGTVAVEASALPLFSGKSRGDVTLSLWDGDREVATTSESVETGWTTLRIPIPAGESKSADSLRLRVETSSETGVYVGTARRLAPKGSASTEDGPRTVVLITSDTHRADHMGLAPNGVGVKTPTLDRLARAGVRFDNATSATSITNPSHASIFTGLSLRDTGIVGNIVLLSDRASTIAEEYREAGFRTFAAVSARHLIPWRSGFGQGFERFDAPFFGMTRDGKETVDAAVEMMKDAEGHDVFLWLHLFDAHAPYTPHDEYTPKYYDKDPFSEKLAELAPHAKAAWDQRIRDAQYVLALYKGEVTYVDSLIEDFLKRTPRVEDGWLAFTADHGESLGEHDLFWTHVGLYPSTLRVPLILSGPNVPSGVTSNAAITNLDVARTLLEASGVGGEDFPGRSLLDDDVLAAEVDEPRYAIGPNALSAGIFSGDWYLLLHLRAKFWGNPAKPPTHAAELYNLAEDPNCENNILLENIDQAKRLRRALVAWLSTPPEGGRLTGEAPSSATARADVAALGYAINEESSIDKPLIDPECECHFCQGMR